MIKVIEREIERGRTGRNTHFQTGHRQSMSPSESRCTFEAKLQSCISLLCYPSIDDDGKGGPQLSCLNGFGARVKEN